MNSASHAHSSSRSGRDETSRERDYHLNNGTPLPMKTVLSQRLLPTPPHDTLSWSPCTSGRNPRRSRSGWIGPWRSPNERCPADTIGGVGSRSIIGGIAISRGIRSATRSAIAALDGNEEEVWDRTMRMKTSRGENMVASLCRREPPSQWGGWNPASFGNQAVRTCPDPWLCVPTSRWVCRCRERASAVQWQLYNRRVIPSTRSAHWNRQVSVASVRDRS